MTIEPVTLRGHHVELVPLATDLVDELVAAANVDRATYSYTEVPATTAQMADYVERLLAKRADGTDLPFAQRGLADGRIVGCTRYLEMRRWRGRPEPDEVEIGGTWLAADVQRSALNTEAKLLLLTHAFDVWQVDRVAVATDSRNERSRVAIERIGARLEGVLRHHRPSLLAGEEGQPRDTALFSITDDEWPAARRRLVDRLG